MPWTVSPQVQPHLHLSKWTRPCQLECFSIYILTGNIMHLNLQNLNAQIYLCHELQAMTRAGRVPLKEGREGAEGRVEELCAPRETGRVGGPGPTGMLKLRLRRVLGDAGGERTRR